MIKHNTLCIGAIWIFGALVLTPLLADLTMMIRHSVGTTSDLKNGFTIYVVASIAVPTANRLRRACASRCAIPFDFIGAILTAKTGCSIFEPERSQP